MKKALSFLAAFVMLATTCATPVNAASDAYDMNISIDLGAETKAISPYIYGINQYGNQKNYDQVTANAVRQGGNRMTAYNWETNASNAGSDWKYSSDNNLSNSNDPADCAQVLSKEAQTYGIDYKLTTLQLAGYVAADQNGTVSEAEAAPSARWNAVKLTKGSAFDATPNLDDGVVYMDEYVNYLINKLGDSTTATGIQGYSLDNEPTLWKSTHSRIHPQNVTIEELTTKSVEMATAVKKLDPHAEIFGPALYGYTAFDHLDDSDASTEWEALKSENSYNWYLDCYLDQMKQASDAQGVRLLDVLDIHYYSESARVGVEDRLQSVRTLYEKGFAENSWIGQWCQHNVPILPTIQASIDRYYPGTKLAISEYNFGGEDLSGTIAHAEALGCYADQGVYLATLWGGNPYQFSAINLYTNYDGKGSHFGDMLVPTTTDDVSLASAYSAIHGSDQGLVTAMITNKDLTKAENVTIFLANADVNYQAAAVYAVYGDTSEIRLLDIIEDVANNQVKVTLPAYSAAMVVITDDASDFKDITVDDPDRYTQKIETFEDLNTRINEDGFVVIPITDAAALKEIRMTADVTSSAGSGWGSAGCAIGMNVKDSAGTGFWTYEEYTLKLGSGSTATVTFDGTFMNKDVSVEAQIADGKVELQTWWTSSEKAESNIEDIIAVNYTKVEVVYEYDTQEPEPEVRRGDVDCDGEVRITDVILLNRWIAEDDAVSVSAQGALNAEMDGDHTLTLADAIQILKVIAGLPTTQ